MLFVLVGQEKNAANVIGYPIELASSKQVAEVLYQKFHVTPPQLANKGRSQAKQKTHPTTSQALMHTIHTISADRRKSGDVAHAVC